MTVRRLHRWRIPRRRQAATPGLERRSRVEPASRFGAARSIRRRPGRHPELRNTFSVPRSLIDAESPSGASFSDRRERRLRQFQPISRPVRSETNDWEPLPDLWDLLPTDPPAPSIPRASDPWSRGRQRERGTDASWFDATRYRSSTPIRSAALSVQYRQSRSVWLVTLSSARASPTR